MSSFFAKLTSTDALVIAPVGLGRLAARFQVNSISWKNKNTQLWQAARPVISHVPLFYVYTDETTHVKLW